MKKTRVISSVMAFSVILITLFASCDNFMSDDGEFKKKLKDDAKVANAAKVVISVLADSGTGTVYPAGYTTVKVDVPFNLLFTPDNSYGFVEWEVYDESAPTIPLVGVVEWGANGKTIPDTAATLKVARNHVLIKPVCVKRPTIEDVYPKENEKGIVRNYPVKILFSKDMNMIASFAYSGDSNATAVTSTNPGDVYSARTFKNIAIEGNSGDPEDPGWKDLSAYFRDPVITNNRLISIVPNVEINDAGAVVSGKALPMLSTIRVTVSTAVVDTSGLEMEDDYSFKFILGEEFDQKPPNISNVDAGPTSALAFDSETEAQIKAHRVNAGQLWLGVDVSDAATGGGTVSALHVYWSLLYGTDGSLIGGPASPVFDVRSSGNLGTNTSWLFEYDQLASLPDGVYQLAVTATDSNSQTTALANAAKYLIAKDTTPPDPANVSKISFDQGWYNASENSITFTPASAIADAGVSVAGSVPSIQSPNIEWRFMVGNGGWNAWTSAASSATIAIPSSVADSNAVPITVQLRDDFANTTADLTCPTIPRDTTAPVVSTIDIQGIKCDGKTMVGSSTVNVTVVGTDNLSGVAQYSLSGSPTPGAFIAYNPGTTNTGSVTISTTEGDHPVNVWVRDAAGNISSVETADTVVDTTDPAINKFFLRTAAFTDSAATLDAEGTLNSYPNNQTCYFGFTAHDAGVGVGSFSYQDEGGAWSEWFDCSTTAITSDTDGTHSVNWVKRTNLDGGLVLVTGTLTISDANKLHDVRLKVRDLVNRESTTPPQPAFGGYERNRVIFDNKAPDITAKSIVVPTTSPQKDYYFDNGTTLFVQSTAQTISVTANDAAGAEISGIRNALITGEVTAPVTIPLGGAPEVSGTVTQTTPITLPGGDVARSIAVSVNDWAGNSVATSVGVTVDQTVPVINTLELRNTSGVKFAGAGEPLVYSQNGTFRVYMSAADSTSGVRVGAVHTVTVAGATPGSATISNGFDSADFTLPTASGEYIAQVTCYDNVNNSQSGQVSFHFDNQAPVYTSMSVYNNDASEAYFKSPNIFTKGTTFYIRAYVTDKPTGDPNGSGLATIATATYWNIVGGVSNGSTGALTAAESAESAPADRWVYVRQSGAADSWNVSGLHLMRLTSRFVDRAGNDVWSNGTDASTSTVIIIPDSGVPNVSITPNFSGSFNDTQNGRTYIQNLNYSYALTDPHHAGAAIPTSGVKEWGLAIHNIAAEVSIWHTYTADGSDTDLLTDLLDASPAGSSAFFLARDNVGNVGSSQIGAGAIYLDNDEPTIGGLTISRTDGITGDGYTTGTTVNITGTLTEIGSGIHYLTFGGTGLSTIPGVTTLTIGATDYTCSVSGKTVSFNTLTGTGIPRPSNGAFTLHNVTLTASDGPKPITLVVQDQVGLDSATGTDTIIYDGSKPVITIDTDLGNWLGYGSAYYTNPAASLAFRFQANDALSGLTDYLISTSNVAALDAITHDLDDAVSIDGDVGALLGSGPLYIHARDLAGNMALPVSIASGHSVILDSDAPSGITVDLDGAGGTESYSTAQNTNEINITFTEAVSGLNTIAITGVADCTPVGPVTRVSYSGGTLLLQATGYPRGGPIALTGISLSAGDGSKTVSVILTDAAGNPSASATSDPVILDTLNPVLHDAWLMRTDGITDPNLSGTGNDYTTTVDVELHLSFTEEGAGIKTLTLGGTGYSSLSGSAVIKRGGDTLANPADYTISSNTITFSETNRMIGATQELTIGGISLATGDGEKQVAVSEMTDYANRSATVTAGTDTIILDATAPPAPTVATFTTIFTGTDGNRYVGPSPTLALTAADSESGIASYKLVYSTSEDPDDAPAHGTMDSYSGPYTALDVSGLFSNSQARYVFVYLGDKAGKISDPYLLITAATAGVEMDDTVPQPPTLAPTVSTNIHKVGTTYYTKETTINFTPTAGTIGDSGLKGYGSNNDSTAEYTTTPINLVAGGHTIFEISMVNLVSATSCDLTVAIDDAPPNAPTVYSTGTHTHLNGGTYYYTTTQGHALVTLTATDAGTTQSDIRGFSTSSTGSGAVTGEIEVSTTTKFWAVDNVGRVSTTFLTVTVAEDGQGPETFSMGTMPTWAYYPGTGTTYYIANEDTKTFTPSATDSGSGMPVNAFYRNSNDPGVTVTIASQGAKTIHVIDNLGNIKDYAITVTLDNVTPGTPTVTYPTSVYHDPATTKYYTTDTPITFTPNVTFGASGLKGYSIDGGATVKYPYVAGMTITLDEGTTNLSAVSNVGLVSETPLTIQVIQDDDEPDTPTVESYGDDTFLNGTTYYYRSDLGYANITLSFSDGENSSGFQGYTTDRDVIPGTPVINPIHISNPATVYFAIDKLNNVSLAGGSVAVQADSTAPTGITLTPEVTSPVNAYPASGAKTYYIKNTPHNFTPDATDTEATVLGFSSSSSGPFVTTAVSLSGDADGTDHDIYASDKVNNVTDTAETFTIIQDNNYDSFTLSVTPITGTDVYSFDGASNTLYHKASGGSATITPGGGSDLKSGHAGYSTSATGAFMGTIPISGNTDIYAIDHLGNNKMINLKYVRDNTPPNVGGTETGWYCGAGDATSFTFESGNETVDTQSGVNTTAYTSSAGSFDGVHIKELTALDNVGDSDTITVKAYDMLGNGAQKDIIRHRQESGYAFDIKAQTPAASRISIGDYTGDGHRKEKIFTSPVDPASFIGLTGHIATSDTAKILKASLAVDRVKGSALKPSKANGTAAVGKTAKAPELSVTDRHEAALARARADLERVDSERRERAGKASPVKSDKAAEVVKNDAADGKQPVEKPVKAEKTAPETDTAQTPDRGTAPAGNPGSGNQPAPEPGKGLPRDVFMPFCMPGRSRKREETDGEE